jgi:hypothetical protein
MLKFTSVLGIGLLLIAATAAAEEEAASGGEKAVDAVQDTADKVKDETQGAAKEAGVKSASGGAYGPAGCGLGSIIFSPDSGFTQVFAATTNGTSGNQTFGITSGTSNCDGTAGGSKSAKAFVQTNRAALAKDIARGKGETISGLSELMSCSNSGAVGAKLQKRFRSIFPSTRATDEQVSDSIVQVLSSDPTLGCASVG